MELEALQQPIKFHRQALRPIYVSYPFPIKHARLSYITGKQKTSTIGKNRVDFRRTTHYAKKTNCYHKFRDTCKMLSEKQTETYFKQAVEELYKNDGYLFDPDHGLHEQTVSHRLAVYLERRFLKNKTFRTCNLSVDCEYNRNRDDCKKLYGPCMDCRESCRIKELKTPFVYDRRSYSDARDFVRSYPEGKPCRPDIIIHLRAYLAGRRI